MTHRNDWMGLALGAGALILTACAGTKGGTHGSPIAPAEALLIHGGTIYLGAPDWASTDALWIVDGRVRATGAEARDYGGSGPQLDLGGAVAIPGLQDAHGHIAGYGESLESVELRGTRSFEEVVARIAARAATLPEGAWILGRGWDQTLWEPPEFPRHAALSAAVPAHPVLVRRVDGHAAIANARALALAGLDGDLRGRAQPEGGRVHLDAEGRATGVLIDTAMNLVRAETPAEDEVAIERQILAAQDALLATGLTCVHDMGISRTVWRVLAGLRDEGRLKLRIVAYLWGNDSDFETTWSGFPAAPDASDMLCAPGVKLMADGALGSRGAALIEDYHDAPGERGLLRLDEATMKARIAAAGRQGLQPAVHAIGDRANRLVLDGFAEAIETVPGFAALRPRVEHAQVVSRADWDRFEALGACPSMQPTHATSDMRWAEDRVGPLRIAGAYAPLRFASERSPLAFGSDFPVERPHPLEGLYAARARQDRDGRPAGGFRPDQRLDAMRALDGFTAGAAWAAHQEDRRGRLAEGFAADVTILDRDPVLGSPRELLETNVCWARWSTVSSISGPRAHPTCARPRRPARIPLLASPSLSRHGPDRIHLRRQPAHARRSRPEPARVDHRRPRRQSREGGVLLADGPRGDRPGVVHAHHHGHRRRSARLGPGRGSRRGREGDGPEPRPPHWCVARRAAPARRVGLGCAQGPRARRRYMPRTQELAPRHRDPGGIRVGERRPTGLIPSRSLS